MNDADRALGTIRVGKAAASFPHQSVPIALQSTRHRV